MVLGWLLRLNSGPLVAKSSLITRRETVNSDGARSTQSPRPPGDWKRWEYWENEEPQGTFQTQRPAVWGEGVNETAQ